MDSPPIAPDRFSGRKLGKYEVVCRLSTGGMAEIFLAFQRGVAGFRKLVVLKRILPDIGADEDIVRMFLDEARITAGFNHPNIAQVYDLDVSDGELFLAMEFIPGATLIEVAQVARKLDEPIPVGFTLPAVRDTALALHYAHTFKDPRGRQRPVIHRDVAEKNIMVTYDGVTKLLDFGIAKAKDRVTRTVVGKVKGTSGYMSPEQVVGEELDARSDIFSLGIVLHECLTGLRLFYGKDAEQGMLAALNQTPVPPSKYNPELGPELDAVSLKALARERENRFGTALEFARALERVAGAKFWPPEDCGAFVQRLFAERREQTRALLEGMADRTGEVDIAALLRGDREHKGEKKETERELPPAQRAPAIDRKPTEPTALESSNASQEASAAYELLKAVAVAAPHGKMPVAPKSQLPPPETALRAEPARPALTPILAPPPSKMARPLADEETVIKQPKHEAEESGPTLRPPRKAPVQDADEEEGEATVDGDMSGERTLDLPPPALHRRAEPAGSRAPPRKKKSRVLAYVVAGVLAAAGMAAGAVYFLHRM